MEALVLLAALSLVACLRAPPTWQRKTLWIALVWVFGIMCAAVFAAGYLAAMYYGLGRTPLAHQAMLPAVLGSAIGGSIAVWRAGS
jgi:hypothetical protein